MDNPDAAPLLFIVLIASMIAFWIMSMCQAAALADELESLNELKENLSAEPKKN